jgi:hypothetical protein
MRDDYNMPPQNNLMASAIAYKIEQNMPPVPQSNIVDLTTIVDIPFLIEGNPSIQYKKKLEENEENLLKNLTKIKKHDVMHYGKYFFLVTSHNGQYKSWI